VDISSSEALRGFLGGRRPDWIVNCAAFTDVDGAEDEPEAARRANALGPGCLAALAAELGSHLIHLSSDYVFDGRPGRPCLESDPPEPLSVYGLSKAEGEAAILAACPSAIVLRSAWLFGGGRRDFVAAILARLRAGQKSRVVSDQTGSPTWSRDLAGALVDLIEGGGRGARGIYQYAGLGAASRYELALAIREEALGLGLISAPAEIEAVTSADYPTRARRPSYSVLSCRRLAEELGIRPPAWRDGLHRYMEGLAAAGG
jgi:dTDP-4-dehydrorhamnose reductase